MGGTTHLDKLDLGDGAGSLTFAGSAFKRSNMVRYTNPIAAELVSIVADVSMANGAQTIAAQPDFPRKLQVRITDADSSVSAGIVTIVGTDASGNAVSEAVSLTGGTATKKTANAFAKVTSATISGLAGAAGADHISIGVAADLGLPGHANPASGSFAVHKANVNNADEAVGTVDATAGTISPTSAPNAARAYDFWFTYTA
jgi:hypothetical protein